MPCRHSSADDGRCAGRDGAGAPSRLEPDSGRLAAVSSRPARRLLRGLIGDQLVGTVTTIIYDRRLAWIGMMLVDAGHRGQGHGQRSLPAALDFLDRSARLVRQARRDARRKRLYEKHGFVVEHASNAGHSRGQRSARSATSRRGLRCRHPAPFRRMEDLFALDRELFGADRRGLCNRWQTSRRTSCSFARAAPQVTGYALWPARHARRPSRTVDGARRARRPTDFSHRSSINRIGRSRSSTALVPALGDAGSPRHAGSACRVL